ncbi:MAG TPA: oligosaccharide flippase family protein [Pseudolabrys sp.]|nr:oligosaccharide flippase family protein [Pseudolabrys sp.]
MAVARNVIANGIGTVAFIGATAATSIFAFRIAGPEQFGLIGFYLTLHGIVAVLDIGLGPGIVREVARARAGGKAVGIGTILYTFQGIFLGLTGLTTTLLLAASWLLARLITADTIPADEIHLALILTAFTIGAQRLRSVFTIFLEGMEQQVTANILQSGGAVIRAGVAIGAMIAVRPSAVVFLAASLAVCALEVVVNALTAWRAVPRGSEKAYFSVPLIRELAHFLATSSTSGMLGALLQNADKLVVSTLLPLDVTGRYLFISQVCLIVVKLVVPNVTAVLPRLSASVHRGDLADTRRVYFAAGQTAACLVGVFVFGATFFGNEALSILTGSHAVADDYARTFTLLAWAYGLNSLCYLPNALLLAEGHPETAFWSNAIATVAYLPSLFTLTLSLGVEAPAFLWLVTNAMILTVFLGRAHFHGLKGQRGAWLRSSLVPQFAVAGLMLYATRMLLGPTIALPLLAAAVIAASGAALGVAALVGPDLREAVFGLLRRRIGPRPASADQTA